MQRLPSSASRLSRGGMSASTVVAALSSSSSLQQQQQQVRFYQSPIGGPAPFGEPMPNANVSEVNAKVDSMFDHNKRMRMPKKKILTGPLGQVGEEAAAVGADGSGGASASEAARKKILKRRLGKNRELTAEEKRRAQVLGPFAKFIKTKGEDLHYVPSSSAAAPPPAAAMAMGGEGATSSSSSSNADGGDITAPIGHDATPLTRHDRRFFASSFEARGVTPSDAHKVRDETNYDHPAYMQQYEIDREERRGNSKRRGGAARHDGATAASEDPADAAAAALSGEGSIEGLFHKLRDLKAHGIADIGMEDSAFAAGHGSTAIASVGQSRAFQGSDPMLRHADSFTESAMMDDDETGLVSSGSDAPRVPTFHRDASSSGAVGTTADPGTQSYLAAQGYAPKDLAYSGNIGGSVPSNYAYASRDGQLTPQRLIDVEMRRAEAEAVATRGMEGRAGGTLAGEKDRMGPNVFIAENFLFKPFSDTNDSERYVPSSEVLEQHEIAKAVTRASAAYIHHTAADVVARDLRTAGGDALEKDESSHAKAQSRAVVGARSSVYGSDLDAFEQRFIDKMRDDRHFPELPPAYNILEPPAAPGVTVETIDVATGKASRVTRAAGAPTVFPDDLSYVNTTDAAAESNPHFPVEAVGVKEARKAAAMARRAADATANEAAQSRLMADEAAMLAAAREFDEEAMAVQHQHAEDDVAAGIVDEGNDPDMPVDALFFSKLNIAHGKREMAPEDLQRRAHVRPMGTVVDSPGTLGYKPPTLTDLTNSTVNRFTLEQWWGEKAHLVDDVNNYRKALDAEAYDRMLHEEGTMDAVKGNFVSYPAMIASMKYAHEFPKNEMIQDEYVVISKIIPTDGTEASLIPVEHRMKMRVGEARRIANGMGLDLIKVNSLGQHSISSYAQCIIADHRYDKQSYVAHAVKRRLARGPPTKECKEMQFRGGTHPHDIWHKSFRIARMLLNGFPVRIFMKDIGGAREGTSAFQAVLGYIKSESLKIKAFHTAGPVHMADDLVEVMLYPSTPRNPKSSVIHPTEETLKRIRDHRLLEHEKEVHYDNVLQTAWEGRAAGTYMRKIAKGTAWAHNDEGMSLKRLRDVKKTQGWLPKGNKELYAARGDVNMNHPFRASHATSIENASYPRSSNLEQAARGIMTIAARAEMDVSEMHDRGETEENETTLKRFYYRVAGDALNLGAQKEAWGIKTNRRKLPAAAGGFATMGVQEDTEMMAKNEAYFRSSS